MFFLPAMALTARFGASNVIFVPFPSGRMEFRTKTGIPSRTAGAIVLGWSTFAPNDANSDASSNAICSINRALGTIRGSDVSIPSTSVQISIASALTAAPNNDAL
jgi:hypothetical protein